MVFLLFLVQWLLFFSYKEIRVMDMQWIVTVMIVLFLDKSYWFSRFVSTDFI